MRIRHWIAASLCIVVTALPARGDEPAPAETAADAAAASPYLLVLGIAQDAGYPHVGCRRECCQAAWQDPSLRRFATSLALVDPVSRQRWLIECTPDFRDQLRILDNEFPLPETPGLTGIFLTHAHIGHYAGLMQLGREALGARRVPVYGMPRMRKFLSHHGPWSQLVGLENITLKPLSDGVAVKLNDQMQITPWLVPHRDEYSETVGFLIESGQRSAVFIPDIDKWEKWPRDINSVIAEVDYVLVDGTFYAQGELPNRDMSEIPHPLIAESMARFSKLAARDRSKIWFIHLNHSNPALSSANVRQKIRENGYHIAEQGQRLEL